MATTQQSRVTRKATLSREVTIERDVLLSMLNDVRFVDLLPPLRTLKQKQRRKKKGCGCGRKTKPNLVQADFENAKRQIANLVAGNSLLQKQLKDLLETKAIRLKYLKVDNSGSVVKKFT